MTIEERLQVLEDIEAIRKLKAAYCAACDDDHNGAALADVFMPDGTWAVAGGSVTVGRELIVEMGNGIRNSGRVKRPAHQVFNPVIEVDGDTATGAWRFLMMHTKGDERSFVRIIGTYDEIYARTPDGWKIKSLVCTIDEHGVYATADEGAMPSRVG